MTRTMRAFFRLTEGASPGARVIEEAGHTAAIVPAVPERSVINSVVYEDPAALAPALDPLAAEYGRAGVRAWTVWVRPEDEDLKRALADAGHTLDATPEAMVRGLEDAVPPRDLDDWTAAGEMGEVAAINDSAYAFEPPAPFSRGWAGMSGEGLYAYVARADGVPSSCVLALDHEGDFGIFAVATRPEARGRGLASRLLAQALADARGRGCETSSLQATRMGRPVYERLGYRGLGPLEMWERRLPAGG